MKTQTLPMKTRRTKTTDMTTDDPQPAKKQRGGKRPGAGRKPTGHKKMLLNIKPETDAKIRSEANRLKISLGAVVDREFA